MSICNIDCTGYSAIDGEDRRASPKLGVQQRVSRDGLRDRSGEVSFLLRCGSFFNTIISYKADLVEGDRFHVVDQGVLPRRVAVRPNDNNATR